ncbi:MAG: NlpC/P60 family protein [Pseudomonadota bacterium]|nr:NlpC/P60 family protein [Pseudomonadota bacterium]
MSGAAALAEARLWLGTPYRHQASCKGAGTDCLGLIRGIWRALYGAEPMAIPAYTPDWSEPARDELLLRTAQALLIPTDTPRPGDVLVFRMRDKAVAKHLGILAGPASFIHAYSGHGVVESSLSDPWRRRVTATFRFPERG